MCSREPSERSRATEPCATIGAVIPISMTELSLTTRARVAALFRHEEVAEAERLLVEECADNLPLVARADPSSLEQLRFAAIRLSGGDLQRLRDAIRLARTDWRDLLVAADFAEDSHAHETWQPRRFDAGVEEQWMAGQGPVGVELALHDPVEIIGGQERGRHGSVVSLLGVEPEPRYLVEFDSGQYTEVFQTLLRKPAESG
jgi:hypothetical protein